MPVIDDIDAIKNAEQALRESEIRMRALLDASQDEILLVSTDGAVLAINKAARARLAKRIAGSDPVGMRLDQLLPKDLVNSRLTVVQQVAATATLVHLEQQIGARWFEFWFYPVVRPDGGVSEVAVYAREITERKHAEANLRILYQATRQSPVSVMITDLKGRIEYVNPKFIEVTGYALAEVIGQNPRILKSGHTSREKYAHLWETISSGGVWRGEFHNKKKNGELFWELALIAPVKDTEGNTTHFVAVKEDITRRKATDEQLRQSQKLHAVGQLTGGIAHDMNNLLAIIIGNLELLQVHVGGDTKKIGEFLTDALWSARRGAELTYQLLAFARRQPLHPEAFNLNEVVEGMSDLLRRTLGAGIDIHVHLAPDLWEARADRGEVERALLNLAVNARDAMAHGGVLTLETGNAVLDEEYTEQYPEVTAGDYVLFAVADTGTGMPPEILERVLEPFFTTKKAGKGSGLGLSMVYGFVKQSGGHFSIYSDVGHGTTVKVYLPRAATAVSHPDAIAKEPDHTFAGKVVLVVEDEAKLTKIAVHMLETLAFRVATAENATQALQRLEQLGRIDVLFTDLDLPGGMNGAELVEEVRRRHPDVHIICTTGYAKDAVLRNWPLPAGTPLITKPYSQSTLSQEFAAVLSRQGADQNRP